MCVCVFVKKTGKERESEEEFWGEKGRGKMDINRVGEVKERKLEKCYFYF